MRCASDATFGQLLVVIVMTVNATYGESNCNLFQDDLPYKTLLQVKQSFVSAFGFAVVDL